MSRPLFLIITLLLTGVLPGTAEPFIAIPEGDFTCTVQVDFHGPLAKDATLEKIQPVKVATQTLKGLVIQRTGKLRKDIMTWSDGTTSEAWTMSETGLTMMEKDTGGGGNCMYKLPRGSTQRALLFPVILDFDTAAISWINPQTFVDKTSQKGKLTLHYQTPRYSFNSIPPRPVMYQVWIDPKTLLPICYDDGDYLYTVTFSDPPTTPLVLPDRFKQDLQHYLNANATFRHL